MHDWYGINSNELKQRENGNKLIHVLGAHTYRDHKRELVTTKTRVNLERRVASHFHLAFVI